MQVTYTQRRSQRSTIHDDPTVVVISDSFHTLPEAVEELERSPCRVRYVHALRRFQDLDADDRAALAEAAAVVTGRVMPIDREALALAPSLRVLALHTSGTDNVDLDAATERGVLVTNVQGTNAGTCADLAMGLILATTRQILRGDHEIRGGHWADRMPPSLGLGDSMLGIVGLGGIGRALAERAAAFGMRIVATTRSEDPVFAERHGIGYLTLDDLLEKADVVAIAASLTPETRGMIGDRELRRMKETAHVVNVSRGEIIDETALVRVLREGRIAGAALDVFEHEPLRRSPLFDLDNVVLTPHIAGLARSSMLDAARRAARNALAVLEGVVPADAVNAVPAAKRRG